MADSKDRLAGRNGEIWRAYTSGRNQEWIGAKYGIDQSRVSQIIGEIRAALPADAREDWRIRALETLQQLHAGLTELAMAECPPAFHAGEVLRDADGNVVLDYGTRLAATDRVVRLQERAARMLGMDSPIAVEARGELRVVVEGLDSEALT